MIFFIAWNQQHGDVLCAFFRTNKQFLSVLAQVVFIAVLSEVANKALSPQNSSTVISVSLKNTPKFVLKQFSGNYSTHVGMAVHYLKHSFCLWCERV